MPDQTVCADCREMLANRSWVLRALGHPECLAAIRAELVCELTRSILRGSREAPRAAELEAENKALKARVRELTDKTIRAQAEQERLRRAVVNARPRIREVPTDLVRPFAPVVCLPYVSPVPYRDTSRDATQELPVLDWPTYPAA